MLEIFESGGDIHAATASKLFDVKQDEVTPKQRRAAKTINFSVLYGVSPFGLSERSEMTREEAKQFIAKYFQTFPKIKEFIDVTIQQAENKGYVENPLGRRRYSPEILSSNFAVRAAAQRAAFNMPLQSLAADILKIAMIKIDRAINNDHDDDDDEIRMLLQVHDELVFEVKKGREEFWAAKIKDIMESAYKLKTALAADAKAGPNWGEMTLI